MKSVTALPDFIRQKSLGRCRWQHILSLTILGICPVMNSPASSIRSVTMFIEECYSSSSLLLVGVS